MDPVRNPYSPGAGRKPSALVGRDKVIDDWSVSLQRAERGKTDQPMILYGLRGVGKTVLLSRLRRDADARDWITVQVEAGSGRTLREMIGEGLYGPLSDLVRPSAGKRLLRALKTALSFKASYDAAGNWNFGIDLSEATGGAADSGVLLTDLSKIIRDVSLAAGDDGVGLALLIDEAQDLSPEEVQTLAAVMQSAATGDLPVLFGLAGLPSLPQTLAEAKSYSERFRYNVIEKLDLGAAREAILKPARDEAVDWSAEALDHVVNASGRYPYFIQQFGQETWNVATETPIQFADAQLGVATGQGQLDNGFFRARWDRTTAAEKQYLRAMCPEGDDGVGSGEVANRLNRAGSSLGPTRANLIHKGLIYAPDHGIVAFTVPGMAGFIARQHD
ncbi:ATP-binding protein [Brachybacterium sp. J144]|uniref:ATP-binding protein n=1 Tax=Brachybacterium sp. J144 TaxID=3116487 RepID=UPI002E788AF0|nr:ATP-binding protein [Brachybacterium sp. J144]MEE1652187.1 ATP-binding protein [Brachybacterium sp. J144]